ncbi:polysaccharide biosynthesis tyrosine autokinase [Fusibacillus kribbianus]|uniref:non-specific protein-tyrosine kinase n=1 Tax=Fusibacillus kribbianus TaxID=3044208 RepID=A0AAP4BA96_9FIRM|nr:polysaccharide biosynthesis tyrosine autokinase [Ruminococcus sp. YH-rum2234]MDI9241568.1 polysaccharide biosynthesis tyrosine autokinase [Ruminococcus sp. YH-rum2234]
MDNKTDKGILGRLDPISIIKDVLREWWVILLMAVSVSLFVNVWANKTYRPEYTTSSTFVVTAKGTNSSIYQNLSYTKELAERFSQVLESNVLKKKVAEELEIDSFTATTSASVLPETNLMELKVTADSALDAYRIMNSIMNNYNTVSDYVIENVILEVIQSPSIPTGPSNPLNVKGIMKKSALITAALFILYFVFFSYMRDTVKNEREVSEKIDARRLGTVYHERKIKSLRQVKKARSVSLLIKNPVLSFRFVESNRMTASRIRSQMDKKKVKVLLVTSVTENEGKSTVAANLALSLAQENKRVLLIDCDFRKPAQYKIFDLAKNEAVNLPEVLKNHSGLTNLIKKQKDSSLYTIFNSKASDSMEGLIENGTLKNILDFCRQKMDYVIMDTSPLSLVADTEELAEFADASVLVVRQDMVLAKDINDAVDILNQTRGRVIGCVFNDVMTGIIKDTGNYGYGGHYGKRA